MTALYRLLRFSSNGDLESDKKVESLSISKDVDDWLNEEEGRVVLLYRGDIGVWFNRPVQAKHNIRWEMESKEELKERYNYIKMLYLTGSIT